MLGNIDDYTREGKRDNQALSSSCLKVLRDDALMTSAGSLFQKGTTLTLKEFLLLWRRANG